MLVGGGTSKLPKDLGKGSRDATMGQRNSWEGPSSAPAADGERDYATLPSTSSDANIAIQTSNF